MKNIKILIILIILTLLIGGIALIFSYIFNFDSSNLCSNKLIEEKYSPDKTYKVFIFSRDCGATTKESLQVELVDKNVNITNDNVGNIFITDLNNKILVNWTTNNSLAIFYSTDQEVYKKETELLGIEIEYFNNALLPSSDTIEPGIIYDRDGNPIYEVI